MSEGYELALAFDTDDPEFVRGVEAGKLYECVRTTDGSVEQVIHATNAEMALRIAESCGRRVRCELVDGVWLNAIFETA